MTAASCPRCGKPARLDPVNPFRPFCSERCQKMDFGDWAAERYRLAANDPADEPGDGPGDSLN